MARTPKVYDLGTAGGTIFSDHPAHGLIFSAAEQHRTNAYINVVATTKAEALTRLVELGWSNFLKPVDLRVAMGNYLPHLRDAGLLTQSGTVVVYEGPRKDNPVAVARPGSTEWAVVADWRVDFDGLRLEVR